MNGIESWLRGASAGKTGCEGGEGEAGPSITA